MTTEFDELQRLATNATSYDSVAGSDPEPTEIKRWQSLFHYSRQEAYYLIKLQRDDINRTRISNDHWDLVR